MKLLIFSQALRAPRGLHALSVPRSDEATDVQRRPNAAHLVLENRIERRDPALKLCFPEVLRRRYESGHADL